MTDITLHIAFKEPALIKEMAAENTSQLLLSRMMVECTDLIDNMATDKVSIQWHILTHEHSY